MNKAEAIRELVKIQAPNDAAEQRRLAAHHAKRSAADVRESLQRQRAINATSAAEIRRHCQLAGLPKL